MLITRRQLLSLAAATPYVASSWYSREAGAVQNVAVVAQRVSGIIETYDRQGFHRTGTAVDQQSAEWLIAEVRRAGLAPVREPYSCSRIDPNTGLFLADGRRVVGLPLFDGAFTDGAGVQGRLGALGSDAELGVGETAPNQAASRSLEMLVEGISTKRSSV